MKLTLETLLNDPHVIKAVIDRVIAQGLDEIFWKRYFDFEETPSRVFKTYIGTVMGVIAGSIIDKDSGKPIRNRKSLGSGVGEVAALGDSYQMDNDRLDMLRSLIDKFNVAKPQDQFKVMNEIIAYITDDVRQCLLAPHKRMDLIVGQLRSLGSASITMDDNPDGIEVLEMTLPVIKLKPTVEQKKTLVAYIKEQVSKLKTKVGQFTVMEMTENTFNKYFASDPAFQSAYKMILGSAEINIAQGIITGQMATQLFKGIGLPAIRIIEEYVQKSDDVLVNTFTDDRVTLLQGDKLGKMMFHKPYEATDPVPTKSYTYLEGGMFIAAQRTDEGRFLEYGAEWIPNFKAPQKIVIFDLTQE